MYMVPADEAGVLAAPTWPARVSGLGPGAEAWLSGIAMLLHAVGFAGSANAEATDPSDMLPRKVSARVTTLADRDVEVCRLIDPTCG